MTDLSGETLQHIDAPWTHEQVMRAERWQRSGTFHPYTCGNRSDHPYEPGYGDSGVLRPTVRGWVCAFCDYTQTWAHDFTLTEEPPQPLPLGALFGSSEQATPSATREHNAQPEQGSGKP